ncbi:hypothetical protein BOX15_Mlig002337g2 [Macrostomum lignano]|uniref:Uncharacterized protein n=1 Tax=Macrostomum lignano TaxID=282301 RepID=A0A267FM47_9PLAT|nr:hypothetical protein BOX15_Mlig002337g2 [Macrostomum lignano]
MFATWSAGVRLSLWATPSWTSWWMRRRSGSDGGWSAKADCELGAFTLSRMRVNLMCSVVGIVCQIGSVRGWGVYQSVSQRVSVMEFPSKMSAKDRLSESVCQGVSVRKCLSGSVCQEVSVRKCLSGSVCQEVSVRKCLSGSVYQEVSVRKCLSGSVCQEVSIRKCLSGSVYQEESVRKCLSGRVCQEVSIRKCLSGSVCQEVSVRVSSK